MAGEKKGGTVGNVADKPKKTLTSIIQDFLKPIDNQGTAMAHQGRPAASKKAEIRRLETLEVSGDITPEQKKKLDQLRSGA